MLKNREHIVEEDSATSASKNQGFHQSHIVHELTRW